MVSVMAMTVEEFRDTLRDSDPPAVAPVLRALWHAAKGNWDEAHRIAQDIDDRSGSWVHAHLHRAEGDLGNARYWYRQAAQGEATDSLEEEWSRIVAELLR
jgi:hypothetical protein